MRYARIDSCECCNGNDVGMSLYTQGCNQRCPGCFNSDIWDCFGGKQWSNKAKNQVLDVLSKSYIKRMSLVGGEPLLPQNVADLADLVQRVKQCYPDKKIWVWSGYTWPQIYATAYDMTGTSEEIPQDVWTIEEKRALQVILETIDVLVDGPFIQEQRDITLKWRGSKNQRVLDVKETLSQKDPLFNPVLYCD